MDKSIFSRNVSALKGLRSWLPSLPSGEYFRAADSINSTPEYASRGHGRKGTALGWGLLSQIPLFCYFLNFSALSKHVLAIEYHVYIWQVLPQLSCGDTGQIWMWFEESNMYFCYVERFAYGEINEQSFSNPHPWFHWCMCYLFNNRSYRNYFIYVPSQ